MRVSDSVVQVESMGGPTLLLGEGYVTLVDAGMPGEEDAILAALADAGRKSEEIRQILITHSDVDHIGGLPKMVAATGARVYAQAIEADVIEGRRPSRGGQMFEPTPVDEIVEDGDLLPFHGGVHVISTFGHTIGHVSYYLPAEGVLIAGDCVGNAEGLAGSRPQSTYDTGQAHETLRKLAALAPATVCFGHGPPLVGDAAEQLRTLADRLERD
jgi:glyoxylase-like metal-dependent hydrolase (beta-lactamase superfamily II)